MSDLCGASQTRLDELLAKRSTPGIDASKIDRRVWSIYGETAHVLVVALAGQARRIAAFDVVHELQLQANLRQLFDGAVATYDGVAALSAMGPHVATFRHAHDAVDAALAIVRACSEHNTKRPAEEALPACAGIGSGTFLRRANEIWGREPMAAQTLATDASEAGQVLVTQALLDQLSDEAKERVRIVNLGRAVPGSPDNFRVSAEPTAGARAELAP